MCVCVCVYSERNNVITMRSNLCVKIFPHFFKCGATKLFCRANIFATNFVKM